ncbi:MAG: M6 family metalloprotease domain-containing protein [Bacteroidetes bacterium]|nr:M6 family metalloprotease domain-containing protein [Bacteroidota bacterium]MCL2302062.1 M6 family metalloprotease domain-containing protein [Lentimicrobiaceae bacterium]
MKKIVVLLFASFLIITDAVFAAPAIPTPVTFTQPNGDTLTVRIKGDERINWYESLDGYTLLFNQAGYLSYSQLDEDGNLQPSGFIATNIEERNIVTQSFLNTIEKNLFYSDVQRQLMLQVWQIEDEFAIKRESNRVIGHYKTLCAFVQFPEKAMTKPMSNFEGLMNQLGYTANGTGSVRDFFKEASYGQFDLTITLCGIYTAPNSSAYYAGNNGSQNCRELARWLAQQVAIEPDIDFSEYDSDNDGVVDGFHFIFAGMGQEAGGGSGAIWSHKWQFSPPVTQNGKSISIYSCSPELLDGSMTTIGVICHEMTHAFGAPDFYDTNGGVGGQFIGTGDWDLMGAGMWNGWPQGNRPAHPNMYTKVQFGWVKPKILFTPFTIQNMPNSAEYPVAYRINTTTPNEHFLLENRQQLKFDTNIPGNGLLIYRVHSNVGTSGINDTHPQRMYPVCASTNVAIPTSSPSSYGNINSAGCPFPGTSNKTSFTDDTAPSMLSLAGNNTNKPITNITHTNRLISFDFMGGGTELLYCIVATCDENGSISPEGETIVTPGSSQAYAITSNAHFEIETVVVNGENDLNAVSTGVYTFTDIDSDHTIHATFTIATYTITFNANGGEGEMEPQRILYGLAQNLTPNSFERTDHLFKDWNTHPDGEGTRYMDKQYHAPTANLTLYAQWEKVASVASIATGNNSIQIVPNPASNFIELRITNCSPDRGKPSEANYELRIEKIEFYNLLGQLVKSVSNNGEVVGNEMTQQISIADLNKGVYFVKVGGNVAKLVVH